MCQDEECQEELQELRADIVAKQKKVAMEISAYRAKSSQLAADFANKIHKVLGDAEVTEMDVIPCEEIQAKKDKIVALKKEIKKSFVNLRRREELFALEVNPVAVIQKFRDQHTSFEAACKGQISQLEKEIKVLVLGSAGNSSNLATCPQKPVNQEVELEAKEPEEPRRSATTSAVRSKRVVKERAGTSGMKRAREEWLTAPGVIKKPKVSSSVQQIDEVQRFPHEVDQVRNQGIKKEVEATVLQCGVGDCSFSFSTAAAYSSHAEARHWTGSSSKPCPIEGCTFGRGNRKAGALICHIRAKHTMEKLFLCDECGRQFSSLASKFAHVKKHQDSDLAICQGCRKFHRKGWSCSQK